MTEQESSAGGDTLYQTPPRQTVEREKDLIAALAVQRLREGLNDESVPWTARKDMIRMGLALAGLLQGDSAGKTADGLDLDAVREAVAKAKAIAQAAQDTPDSKDLLA
jgi:hypothetical protein